MLLSLSFKASQTLSFLARERTLKMDEKDCFQSHVWVNGAFILLNWSWETLPGVQNNLIYFSFLNEWIAIWTFPSETIRAIYNYSLFLRTYIHPFKVVSTIGGDTVFTMYRMGYHWRNDETKQNKPWSEVMNLREHITQTFGCGIYGEHTLHRKCFSAVHSSEAHVIRRLNLFKKVGKNYRVSRPWEGLTLQGMSSR